MKNVLHKKGLGTDTNPSHIEPPQNPLVKERPSGKSDGDYFKLKLPRDPTSSTSDLYEFMMYLFYHGKPEEFLLFVQNFQMTLAATGTLETESKAHYLHTLERRGSIISV